MALDELRADAMSTRGRSSEVVASVEGRVPLRDDGSHLEYPPPTGVNYSAGIAPVESTRTLSTNLAVLKKPRGAS
jgi:hypothetical protein